MQRREALGLPPGDTDPFYDSIDLTAADEVASMPSTIQCAQTQSEMLSSLLELLLQQP